MDHSEYCLSDPTNAYQSDVYIEVHDEKTIMSEKVGDDLLIDLIRSRPHLYNKIPKDHQDPKLKKKAWREIAALMNISASECELRWIRLRQHYSKERKQRELEMKSGSGKKKRKKWPLYESLMFLDQHVAKRKSFCNVASSASAAVTAHPIQERNRIEMSPQGDNIKCEEGKENCRDLHESYDVTSPMATDEQNIFVSDRTNIVLADKFEPPATPSASSSSTVESEPSRVTSPPTTCYSNYDRRVKGQKADPIEAAFHRLSTTITAMVEKICTKSTKATVGDDDDPDVIIGKLVTATLKNTAEPKKEQLKKKIMSVLYSLDA